MIFFFFFYKSTVRRGGWCKGLMDIVRLKTDFSSWRISFPINVNLDKIKFFLGPSFYYFWIQTLYLGHGFSKISAMFRLWWYDPRQLEAQLERLRQLVTSGEAGEKGDLASVVLGEKGDLASVVVVAAQLHHPATEGEVMAPRPPPPSR